jgi:LemA protein
MEWILLGLVLLVPVLGVITYNRLVTARNRYRNAFAQIDVQLTRRYDLIPNLVKVAERYMQHERETLEAVIQARNGAVNQLKQTSGDPGDPDAMRKLSQAEQGLSGALGRLFALSENYPDLKANQNFMELQRELTDTEDKIAYARQFYNDQVMRLNTLIQSFPSSIVARASSYEQRPFFEIDEPTRGPVQVDLS